MPLLVRRINRAKWAKVEDTDISNSLKSRILKNCRNFFLKNNDVCADAITNCLKTFNNDLSVWHIETGADLDKAILALVTGSNQTKLSTLHIVMIEEVNVLNKGIELANSLGDTVVKELANSHKNMTNLTYTKLGIVKDLILDSIKEDKYAFYTRRQLKDLIIKALQDGKVNKDDLNADLIAYERL